MFPKELLIIKATAVGLLRNVLQYSWDTTIPSTPN